MINAVRRVEVGDIHLVQTGIHGNGNIVGGTAVDINLTGGQCSMSAKRVLKDRDVQVIPRDQRLLTGNLQHRVAGPGYTNPHIDRFVCPCCRSAYRQSRSRA